MNSQTKSIIAYQTADEGIRKLNELLLALGFGADSFLITKDRHVALEALSPDPEEPQCLIVGSSGGVWTPSLHLVQLARGKKEGLKVFSSSSLELPAGEHFDGNVSKWHDREEARALLAPFMPAAAA